MRNDPVSVIVDNRERNVDVLEGLANSSISITFAQLPVGDYIVSDRIGIERKTVSDFENSIMNARLFDQLERLSVTFKKPILIVEGDESEFVLGQNVILGTMVSVFTDYNIQLIWTADSSETAAVVSKIAEREQRMEKREPRILGSKRAFTTTQWQILILSSIPGIGPKLAAELIKHFKSIRNVLMATPEQLKEVKKIGNKKATAIYGIINAEFSGVAVNEEKPMTERLF